MGNRIEVAKSGRAKCCTCNEVIPKGTPRLSEETSDIGIPDLIHRFYHLKCAAAVHPEVVAAALLHVDDGVVFDRAELEAKIAPAVARATELRKAKYLAAQAEKEAKTKAVIVEADDTTNELLSQLDANPEDPGTLAVVADQLQARNDIRGELIALQLGAGRAAPVALEGDDDEETDATDLTTDSRRRSRRIAELMDKLSIPLDPGDKAIWGVGFIRRLELHDKNGTRLSSLAPIWKHPSLRFLAELQLTLSSTQDAGFIERLVELAPKSLRVLELGNTGYTTVVFGGLATLVAALPRLEQLAVTGRPGPDAIAHPTLRRLDISKFEQGTDRTPPLGRFAAKNLPAVDTINLHAGESTLAIAVATLGTAWFKRLANFGWIRGTQLTADDVAQLAAVLGKKHKLARLDLTGTKVPLGLRDMLAKLCTELVAPDLALNDDQIVYIEHTNKPEWGRGTLVSKKEGKIEVKFPKPIGLKVFKADAPFLKLLA